MQKLDEFFGDNYGGFYKIHIAKVLKSNVFVDLNQTVLYENISPFFSEISFTAETGFYKFDLTQSPSGAFFSINISCAIPKFRTEVLSWIHVLKNCRFIVLLETFTSGKIVFGDAKYPLIFKMQYSSGTKVKNINQYVFSFSGKTIYPPVAYKTALADFDPKDFSRLDFLTP